MSFANDELTQDAFLGGRLMLLQPQRGYRAATDPVFLAAFAPAQTGDSVLDIGTGAGTAALCLGARVPGLDLHGLEIQSDYAELARRNAATNHLALTVHAGDLRAMPPALRQRNFDTVILNPPFHDRRGSVSPDAGRAAAHREEASLAEWIAAGLRRLRPGGALALIHSAGRLGTILAALDGKACSAEILPLAPRSGRTAHRVLVRARKGARAPLVLYPPFVVHKGQDHASHAGAYTPEAEAVLRDMATLLQDAR